MDINYDILDQSSTAIKEGGQLSNNTMNDNQFGFLKETVEQQFKGQFPNADFESAWKEYSALQDFKISQNVETVGGISEEAHFVMRVITEHFMTEAFKAMKIDLNDPNVAGPKGTPYRITKMYTGAHLNDSTELLSGRWAKKPQVAYFPNEHNQRFPITKRVDIVSTCSHHLAPFSTMFRDDAYCIVSYIPSNKLLGISKLQRIVDWVARRGHLQEDLTNMIYNEISTVAETDSVYVRLSGLMHTCESLRGTQSKDGSFTSEFYGGEFENIDLRIQVMQD